MASSAQPIIHHNIDNSNNTDINLANRNTATIPTTAANSITNSIEVITLRLRICFYLYYLPIPSLIPDNFVCPSLRYNSWLTERLSLLGALELFHSL